MVAAKNTEPANSTKLEGADDAAPGLISYLTTNQPTTTPTLSRRVTSRWRLALGAWSERVLQGRAGAIGIVQLSL